MEIFGVEELLKSPYIKLKLNGIAELKDGAPEEVAKQYEEYRKTAELAKTLYHGDE